MYREYTKLLFYYKLSLYVSPALTYMHAESSLIYMWKYDATMYNYIHVVGNKVVLHDI